MAEPLPPPVEAPSRRARRGVQLGRAAPACTPPRRARRRGRGGCPAAAARPARPAIPRIRARGRRPPLTARTARRPRRARGRGRRRDAELVDVAGEEPVRALRSRARADRADHVRRQLVPARPAARVAAAGVGRGPRCPASRAASGSAAGLAGRRRSPVISRTASIKELVRDGEQPPRSPPRAAPPCPVQREQGGQRQEHRQPQAGEAVRVDAGPGPVTGRGEPGIADGAAAAPR